ncbi:MAG: DNA polymerase IV [Clostridia bacterium]|nr:DNA polymerase IV [Clostridia bacterium]
MAERVILHCDLNNFFASVECLGHPEYLDVPMAVCGSVEERHGIVLAKNERAKKFGVKTAEAIWEAQIKCPSLVIAPPHYEEYLKYSKLVRAIYEEYTDKVEPFGMDECWLDVTGSVLLFGDGKKIAYEIKERVKNEIGLTISVGVSFNKVFAKLASDMKKPDAVTVIGKENFRSVVWPLQAEEMIGVGKATKRKLNGIGIYTLGELANADASVLKLVFGKMGEQLKCCAAGKDNSPVLSKSEIPPAKSFGRSITCAQDLKTTEEVAAVMLYLTGKVAASLRENNVMATVVQIHIRDENLIVRECQAHLSQPTRITEMLYSLGMELFSGVWKWERNVRSIGIRACELVPEDSYSQYNLFYSGLRYDKLEKLEAQVFNICSKYGKNAVFRASTMRLSTSKNPETPGINDVHYMAKN